MAQAERTLRNLPGGVLVGWGDATCAGLTYPPREIMRSIRLFAARNKIDLIVLPGQCDQH
jgi:hypothetical protein